MYTASGLRLSISPRGTQIKTIDSGIIFTCVVAIDDAADAQQQLPTAADMRWVGPDMQYVSSTKGSRYAQTDLFTASAQIVFDVVEPVNQDSEPIC